MELLFGLLRICEFVAVIGLFGYFIRVGSAMLRRARGREGKGMTLTLSPYRVLFYEDFKGGQRLFWCAVFTVGLASAGMRELIQTEEIGSYFEKSEYVGDFVVMIRPDTEVPAVRAMAEIEATILEGEHYTNDDEVVSDYQRCYFPRKVLIPGGGVVLFEEHFDYDPGNSLELGKEVVVIDDLGKFWRIEMTRDKRL